MRHELGHQPRFFAYVRKLSMPCIALFCLYKDVVFVWAALFFYCDVFVTLPCDHVKVFPSFILGGCTSLFFAYIRHVLLCCAALFFYCEVFVTLPCDHVKMFPSFIVQRLRFFCLYKGCAALFSIVVCLLSYHVTM